MDEKIKKYAPRNAGRHAFKPTADDRKTVSLMAAVGIPQEGIALCIQDGINDKTLRYHFKKELKTASLKANAKVGGMLYQAAMNGNVAAMIWWTKSRMGWKETKTLDVDVGVRQGVLTVPNLIEDTDKIVEQKIEKQQAQHR